MQTWSVAALTLSVKLQIRIASHGISIWLSYAYTIFTLRRLLSPNPYLHNFLYRLAWALKLP